MKSVQRASKPKTVSLIVSTVSDKVVLVDYANCLWMFLSPLLIDSLLRTRTLHEKQLEEVTDLLMQICHFGDDLLGSRATSMPQ